MRRILYHEQLLLSRNRRLFFLIVYVKVTKVALKNVDRMGRRKFHGGQFSGEYQPAKKIKTKEEENEKRANNSLEGSSTDSSKPKDFLKAVNELQKIEKLCRDCKRFTTENANLKRTIHTLRKSLSKYRQNSHLA